MIIFPNRLRIGDGQKSSVSLKEGERLGSVEGAAKARKRQMMQDKKLQEAEWQARNAKALEIAKGHGIDGKHLVEQADASLVSFYILSLIWNFSHPLDLRCPY